MYVYLISCSTQFKNKEALGISNIVRKLQLFFGHDFPQLSQRVQELYLSNLTRITCCFIKDSQVEEAVSFGLQLYIWLVK